MSNLDNLYKAACADLVAMAENYPTDENADNREVWRRTFDRLQMDVERLAFAKTKRPPPTAIVGRGVGSIDSGIY
jgi:hypothetical protein